MEIQYLRPKNSQIKATPIFFCKKWATAAKILFFRGGGDEESRNPPKKGMKYNIIDTWDLYTFGSNTEAKGLNFFKDMDVVIIEKIQG